MLRQLYFISHKGFIKGGSTRPVLIEAKNDEGEIGQYVLKIYNKSNEFENFATSKEFISCHLASEFDLWTPDYFVIEIIPDFVQELFSEDELKNLHFGYHFCTNFIPGCLPYNTNAPNKFLKGYDFANVFSFDFLILNSDRGGFRNKPNILIKDENFYLIDHELTFPFNSNVNSSGGSYEKSDFYNQTNVYSMSMHIFHHIMQKKRDEPHLFDEFEYHLLKLKLNKLEELFQDFGKFRILNDGLEGLISYLLWCKNNKYLIKTLFGKLN